MNKNHKTIIHEICKNNTIFEIIQLEYLLNINTSKFATLEKYIV